MSMNYLEMLARLGVGSAHPGGFTATLEQLSQFPIPEGSKILDAGCGTGRTACYLAKQGHDVTGIDLLPAMVAKARRRACEEQVEVRFVQGDICALPFESGVFDVVLAESVTVFADAPRALAEYRRVLKPGGVLYDREIMAMGRMEPQDCRVICEFYGISGLMTPDQWVTLLSGAGFIGANVWKPSVFPENLWEDQIRHPDLMQHVDEDAWTDRRIWEISFRYDDIMQKYRHLIGYGVAIGTNGPDAANS